MTDRPAVLITGAGRRYDIVSAFAEQTTTIACDLNPLAPAQYAAQLRAQVPPNDDPAFVATLERLCAEHGVGAIVPLIDPDIEILAAARQERGLPAFVPDPDVGGDQGLLQALPGALVAGVEGSGGELTRERAAALRERVPKPREEAPPLVVALRRAPLAPQQLAPAPRHRR